MEGIKMKKITKGLCLILAIVACLTIVQPVNAATKYSKAEKKLAWSLACYQDNELLCPDTFKIKNISKVKYVLDKENYEMYEALDLLDYVKTIDWKVTYIAENAFGANVKEVVYVSSTGNYFGEDDIDFEEYHDKTDYAKSNKSDSFVKKIKKLTSKYYKEM
jgi:hypothetical protein